MKIVPNFKLWMEMDGKTIISDGRAALLLEIDKCGTLSQAARNRGISYRHAYNLVGNLNERCGFIILQTKVGGYKGGGMQLTEAGKRLLQEYYVLKMNMTNTLNAYTKLNE